MATIYLAFLLIGSTLIVYIEQRYVREAIAYWTGSSTVAALLLLGCSLTVFVLALGSALRPQLKFIWHCFIRPLHASDQRTRLDNVRKIVLKHISHITYYIRSFTRARRMFMMQPEVVFCEAGTPCSTFRPVISELCAQKIPRRN